MNIRDVARRAKVSTATVSRVMSGTNVVSPQTAARVRKAIDELDYVADSSARTLSMGRSRLFGLLISDITNPFFPDLVYTFNELALQHKYRAVFANTNYDPARMEVAVQGFLEQKVEGIAIMTSEMNPELISIIARKEIPMVFLDEPVAHKHASFIEVDYKSGMIDAIEHVTALGHTRIAYIGGPQNLRSAARRQNNFLGALRDRGVAIDDKLLTVGNHRVDGGYAAMRRLLQHKPLPTAVLTSNDLTAIGAISAIYEAGLQVPRDISVVGFDDIEISSALNPPLTTVRLSRADIATRAFFALYSATNRTSAPQPEHLVKTELIVRKSTAPPSAEHASAPGASR
jgi:DNA-binding LacI/PurR family transcriptional regulator